MSPRGVVVVGVSFVSCADVADALFHVVVKTIVHPVGFDGLKSLHPIVFSLFQEPTVFGFRIFVIC